jgi:hypothetical protein
MLQYVPESEPGTQLIPTERIAFSIIVAGGWALASWFLIDVSSESTSVSAILSEWLQFSLGAIVSGLCGAVVGAVLALLAGRTLSRQFCWIFAVSVGMWSVPVLSAVFVRTVLSVAPTIITSRFFKALGLMAIVYPLMCLVAVICGIWIGVIITRRRLGFGARSQRAARLAAVFAVPVAMALELCWSHLGDKGSFADGNLRADSVLLVLGLLIAAMISGLIFAEPRQVVGGRFEVLPIPLPQGLSLVQPDDERSVAKE